MFFNFFCKILIVTPACISSVLRNNYEFDGNLDGTEMTFGQELGWNLGQFATEKVVLVIFVFPRTPG